MTQTQPQFCRRVLQTLILALMVSCPWSITAANDGSQVSIRIQNDSSETLRCEAILAHFVTLPLSKVPPHQSIAVTLGRDLPQGTLSLGQHKGSPMMLENILCAVASQWDKTKTDLPILDLRANPANHFAFSCKLSNRLLCNSISP